MRLKRKNLWRALLVVVVLLAAAMVGKAGVRIEIKAQPVPHDIAPCAGG